MRQHPYPDRSLASGDDESESLGGASMKQKSEVEAAVDELATAAEAAALFLPLLSSAAAASAATTAEVIPPPHSFGDANDKARLTHDHTITITIMHFNLQFKGEIIEI